MESKAPTGRQQNSAGNNNNDNLNVRQIPCNVRVSVVVVVVVVGVIGVVAAAARLDCWAPAAEPVGVAATCLRAVTTWRSSEGLKERKGSLRITSRQTNKQVGEEEAPRSAEKQRKGRLMN